MRVDSFPISTIVEAMARCIVICLFCGITSGVAVVAAERFAKPVEAQWPLEMHSLDATTGRLLDSFSRLLNDPTKDSNQSQFTRELTDAALKIIYNVPPSLISQKVEKQTETAARTTMLPNPDGEGCLARDYSPLCPEDFYDTGDGKNCEALPTYTGNCDKTQDLSSATAMDRRAFSARCGTKWPCRESCTQEYSFQCPLGWSDVDGQCSAPASYNGDCIRQKDFRHYDEPSKKNWSQRCSASWPCRVTNFDFEAQLCPVGWIEKADGVTCEAPRSYLGPCAAVHEIGTMKRENKAAFASMCKVAWPADTKNDYDFSRPCPLGWTRLSERYLECHAPKHYDSPCQKMQSFEGFSDDQKYSYSLRCGVKWPRKDSVRRNYSAPCPAGWTLESKKTGICQAPETYDGPCDPRTSFERYNQDMKNAWEHACKSNFPVYALTVTPKIETLLDFIARAGSLNGTGPIGSSGTKYSGEILEANGTVYLPSRDYQKSYLAESQPKTPDTSAREAKLTEEYITELRKLKEQTTDSHLLTAIEDTISGLAAQGGST